MFFIVRGLYEEQLLLEMVVSTGEFFYMSLVKNDRLKVE